MSIKDLPKDDLPRERLIKHGAKNLSDEELLAIILRTGTKDIDVKLLSQEILKTYNGVKNLRYLTINKATNIKGLGLVKAVTLLASLELGKRVYSEHTITNKLKVNNASIAYKYFSKLISLEKQENFLVIYLDNQKKLIKYKILFIGTINESIVHPREVFKEAFLESASSIILMHNHPSGNVFPSKADDEITSTFAQIGELMGIKVLDHIIVSSNSYYSYIESERLKYV